MIWGQDNK